jgi:hypothetical protein
VVAAPPSRVYRLRKLVRKHRGALIAASLVTAKSDEALAKLRLARADQEALAAVPMASNEARKELAGTIFRIARKVIVERVMLCRDCGRSI